MYYVSYTAGTRTYMYYVSYMYVSRYVVTVLLFLPLNYKISGVDMQLIIAMSAVIVTD